MASNLNSVQEYIEGRNSLPMMFPSKRAFRGIKREVDVEAVRDINSFLAINSTVQKRNEILGRDF